MRTRIYLLRHGATELNRLVPYRLQGRRSDPGLDDVGQEQARRAAGALARAEIAAVYASPLRRAMETAGIVGAPHALEPEGVAGLMEAEIGRWEGMTWDEARAADPEWYETFHHDPGRTPYPGGESFADVAVRGTAALLELAGRHGGAEIVVVGHNVLNRAVLAGPLGVPIEKARGLRQANGGINVLDVEGGKITVEACNCCLHLEHRAAA